MSKTEYRRRDFTPGPCYLPPDADDEILSPSEIEAAEQRAAIMAGGASFAEKLKRDAQWAQGARDGIMARAQTFALREAFREKYTGPWAPNKGRPSILKSPSEGAAVRIALAVNPWLDRLQFVLLGAGFGLLGGMWITGGL